jgi:macrodomain Ter protein organizer (MatP/YcbG family)
MSDEWDRDAFIVETLRIANEMRAQQKKFFQNRDSDALRQSKQLERVFDNRLAELQRRDKGERGLF